VPSTTSLPDVIESPEVVVRAKREEESDSEEEL
jgi:hypothetical protein